MNNSPNRNKRLAFVLSGATDALLGGLLLLMGFGWLPIDVADYGLQNWHVIVLGGIFFVTGLLFMAYHLFRWSE